MVGSRNISLPVLAPRSPSSAEKAGKLSRGALSLVTPDCLKLLLSNEAHRKGRVGRVGVGGVSTP